MNTLDEILAGAGTWTLLHDDSMKILAGMPPELVDHVICDPPYDEQTHGNARRLWRTGERWRDGEKADLAQEIVIDFEPLENVEATAKMLLRVTKRWALSFCAVEMLGDFQEAVGKNYLRGGIWDRLDGTPQLSGDRPAQAVEGIAIMHADGKKKWNARGKRGIWRHGVEREGRIHPTQKPISLMLELLRDFTDPGDLVLDPFAGSGTTGAACIQLGRRFIGIEKDREYFEGARGRLENEVEGLVIRKERFRQTDLL